MKIKRMTATFGKLNRSELILSDGLNVIYAPNEAGKSTWCGFLRAMFYGIETTQRDRKGFLAEKNRYAPWSGAPMEGEVELEWQGRDIILRRFAAGNTPFGGFSAVYADTRQPIPELNGDNCGQVLLGVDRGVWERSAFVGQGPSMAIDGTGELERRIAALVSSGQEDVSYSESRETLGKWLRRRKHNKSGLIPQLEEELTEVEATLQKRSDAHRRLVQAEGTIARLEEELRSLKQEEHIHKRLAQRERNQRYAQALQQRSQIQNWLGQLNMVAPTDEELAQMRRQLGRVEALEEEVAHRQDARLAATEQVEQARRDCPDHPLLNLTREQMEDLHQECGREQKRSGVLSVVGALCIVAALGLGVLFWRKIGMAAAAFGALAVVGLVLLWVGGRCRHRGKTLMGAYAVDCADALPHLWQQQQQHRVVLEQAEQHMEQCQQEYNLAVTRNEAARQELTDLLADILPEANTQTQWVEAIDRATDLNRDAARLNGELALVCRQCAELEAQGAQETDTLELLHEPQRTPEQTQQRLEQVERDLSEQRSAMALAQGELLSLGDGAQLEARREWLCAQLERRRMEYRAIEQAIEALDQADRALQQRFAPQLNRLAGQLLAQMTDGRYTELSLSRDFEAGARPADGVLPRSALALSRGTAEQIYLAVRLAVYQLCLPDAEASPVVLDDALVTFDDVRMAAALRLLAGMGRQVLLFSCQRREAEQKIGNILTLQSE